jgi:tRNA (cytosine38-C5)-methyltransferase
MSDGKSSADEFVSRRAAKKVKPSLDENNATNIDIREGTVQLLSYVEFYSGIGGWTMALEEAIGRISERKFHLRRITALDHSDLCTKVFEHNFGTDPKSFAIERLTLKQVEEWKATVWVMSPPCQPHTRQHSNQAEDLKDPRSASFLHLVDLIRKMREDCLPSLLCLENVVGFESSRSSQLWIEALEERGYSLCSFHLSPTQFGLPNDRPRYFSIAVKKESVEDERSSESEGVACLQVYKEVPPTTILTAIPALEVKPANEVADSDLPCISSFLDKAADHGVLQVPSKVFQGNAAWCFDIVTPSSRRSSCFTQSYGRYIRGTGSVLYQDENRELNLVAPEDRTFDEDWAKDLDFSKMRYFSGMEMARLMGFSNSFSFPSHISNKQQWKLIGNSLNVRVASRVVELGLRLMTKPKLP